VDQLYFEQGYLEDGYYTIIREANVDLSAIATATAAVSIADATGYYIPDYIEVDYFVGGGALIDATGSWSSEFQVAATIGKLVVINSELVSESTQTALAGRILEAAAEFTSAFTPTLTADAFKNSTAILDVVADFLVDAVANRSANVLLEHIADLNAMAAKTVDAVSPMAASTTVTSSANLQLQTSAALSSTASLSCSALNVQFASAAFTARSTLFASRYFGTGRPRIYTLVGSPSISTSVKKFGAGSAYFAKNSVEGPAVNYVTIPDSKDWQNFGTIDFWLNKDVGNTSVGIIEQRQDNNNVFRIATVGTQLSIERIINGNYVLFWGKVGLLTESNTWTHIRICNDGQALTVWKNGSKITPDSGGVYTNTTADFTAPLIIGGSQTYSSRTDLYLDELIIRSDAITSSSTTTFSVPTDRWTVTDQTNVRVLSHFDTDFSDDVGLTQTAAATLTSSSTVTAQANANIKIGSAALNSTATVTANASKLVEGSASAESASTVTVTATRVRSAASDLGVESNFAVAIDVVSEALANLTAEFTQTATVRKINDIDLIAFSEAAVSLLPNVIRDNSITATAEFNIAAVSSVFRTVNVEANSNFNLASQADRTRAFVIETQSEFSLVSDAVEVVTAQPITLTATANIFVDAEKILGTSVSLASQFTAFVDTSIDIDEYTVTSLDASGKYWSLKLKQDIIVHFTNSNSLGKTFLVGNQTIGSDKFHAHYQIDSFGNKLFVDLLSSTNPDDELYSYNVIVDASNNWYVYGVFYDNNTSYYYPVVFKYNSANILQWRKKIDSVDTVNVITIDEKEDEINIAVDTAGNVYVLAQNTSDSNDVDIIKFSSNGSKIYQKSIAVTPGLLTIACDPSNNIIIATVNQIVKLDSNGNFVWGRTINHNYNPSTQSPPSSFNHTDLTIDSSGSIYVMMQAAWTDIANQSPARFQLRSNLFKLNTTGTIAWQRYWLEDNTNNGTLFGQITNDTDGNVYWNTHITAGSTGPASRLVSKIATNGSLVWKRKFNNPSSLFGYADISINDNDDAFILTLKPNDQIVKLPLDGSLTGTYDGTTYEDATNWNLYNSTWSSSATTFTVTTVTPGLTVIDYGFTKNFASAAQSQFTVNAEVSQFKATGSSASIVSTLSANAVKIISITKDLNSAFSQTTQANRSRLVSAELNVTATADISVIRNRFVVADLTSEFTLTPTAVKQTGVIVSVVSEFTQNTDGNRIRFAQPQLESIASQLTIAAKNATGTITLEAEFAQSTNVSKTTDPGADLNATVTLQADFDKTTRFAADIDSDFAIEIIADKIQSFGAVITAESTVFAQTADSKITRVNSNLESEFTASISGDRFRNNVIESVTDATLDCSGDRIRFVNAELEAVTDVLASPTFIIRATADLLAFNAVVTVGDVINIDPFLQLKIAQETRRVKILPESRTLNIEQETRTLLIKGHP
jgi:hypothetical protein